MAPLEERLSKERDKGEGIDVGSSNVKEKTQIEVAVRIAPVCSFEKTTVEWRRQSEDCLQGCNDNDTFTFDKVFDAMNMNEEIYDTSARPLIESALHGYNVTIAAYGQSGSGKTHTLTGSNGEPGIVQLTLRHIFEAVTKSDRQYMLHFSYLELYNERICDLLAEEPQTANDLPIRESGQDSMVIDGLSEVVITSELQVEQLMEQANRIRKVSSTNINERSSRSHALVRIAIESSDALNSSSRCSLVYLLDLAGSENVKQAGTALNKESRQEAANINKSLLALSNVISALAFNQTVKTKEAQQFVNYRNSKLTRILKPSLGGNSRTLLVCCISPTTKNESLNTLRFAQKARKIENRPVVCEQTEDGMLAKCLKEIEQLKRQLEERKENAADEEDKEKEERKKDAERDKLKQLIAQILSAQTPPSSTVAQHLAKRNRRMTWGGGDLPHLPELTKLDMPLHSLAFSREHSPPIKRSKILPNIQEDDQETSHRMSAVNVPSEVGAGPMQDEPLLRPSSAKSTTSDLYLGTNNPMEEDLRLRVAELERRNAQLETNNECIAAEAESAIQLLRAKIMDLSSAMELYSTEMSDLKTQNDALALENKELHIKADAAMSILNEPSHDHNSTLNGLSAELALLQSKLDAVAGERDEFKQKVDSLDSQIRQQEMQKEELQAEIRASEKAVKMARLSADEAKKKIEEMEIELDRLSSIEVERDRLRECNDHLQKLAEQKDKQLDTVSKEHAATLSSLIALQQKAEAADTQLEEAAEQRRALELALDKLTKNCVASNESGLKSTEDFTRQLAEAMHQNETFKRALDNVKQDKEQITKQMHLIIQENAALQKQVDSLTEEQTAKLKVLNEQLQQVQVEKQRMHDRLKALCDEDDERKRTDIHNSSQFAELQALKNEIERLNRQLAEFKCEQCTHSKEQLGVAQEKLKTLAALMASQRKTLENKEAALNIYMNRVNMHRDEMRQKEEEVKACRLQAQEKLKNGETAMTKLRKQMEAEATRLKTEVEKAKGLAQELSHLQKKYNVLKDTSDEAWMRLAATEKMLIESRAESERLHTQLEVATQSLTELQETTAKQRGKETETQTEAESIQLEQTMQKMSEEIEQFKVEIANKKNDIRTLLQQKKNGLNLYNALKKEKEELAMQNEELKTRLLVKESKTVEEKRATSKENASPRQPLAETRNRNNVGIAAKEKDAMLSG